MELAGSNKIYVYSWKDEEVVSEITVKGGVRDLAATADGKYLAVCDDLFRVEGRLRTSGRETPELSQSFCERRVARSDYGLPTSSRFHVDL